MLLPFWKVDGFPSFQVTKTEAAKGTTALLPIFWPLQFLKVCAERVEYLSQC